MKVSSSRRFFNRELSWLFFNARVLDCAQNTELPLFERLRFLAISASNLDEFYMVRVAGLRTQVLAGLTEPSADGYTPKRQLEKIAKQVGKIIRTQNACWKELRQSLKEQNIDVTNVADLSKEALDDLDIIYQNQILPLLSPLAIDPAHPFPFIANLGFGLVLKRKHKANTDLNYALILVPSHVPRLIKVAGSKKKKRRYVLIEDVLSHYANTLFPDDTITDSGAFRITRDSDIAVDEEAEDLVRHFEFLIKKRRRGRVIRLEMAPELPVDVKEFLIESFECWDEDIADVGDLLGLADVSDIIDKDRSDLIFPPFSARFPERIREYDGDCFAAIASKDILVHHPYEEFDVVIQFLKQAARDPDVVAIKQTLYRTSDDSPIVRALIEAAENGKNVTALVELKARFDEESNLRWARDLERAGAHVVYGFIDYKTHAKVSLIIRREGQNLQSYTHLGTGNYHVSNAKVYTDLALFTQDQALGRDVGKMFNYVTSYSEPRDLEKLILAPLQLRNSLKAMIKTEMAFAADGKPAQIWAKMNALVDTDIIEALYAASEAGVIIDLIVRGICCLRPGVPGLSENIRVKSIVGRYLEHSRIVCFGNGKALPSPQAKIFFSSADWMPRNLNRRIETLVPVTDTTVRRQIMNQIMIANLKDDMNSWDLRPNGRYEKRHPLGRKKPFSAHKYFMENPSLSGRGKSLKYNAPQDITVTDPAKKAPDR